MLTPSRTERLGESLRVSHASMPTGCCYSILNQYWTLTLDLERHYARLDPVLSGYSGNDSKLLCILGFYGIQSDQNREALPAQTCLQDPQTSFKSATHFVPTLSHSSLPWLPHGTFLTGLSAKSVKLTKPGWVLAAGPNHSLHHFSF